MIAVKTLASFGLVALSVLPLQERVKKQRMSFETALGGIEAAWKEQRFSAVSAALKTMGNHLSVARTQALYGALPEAPDGWTKKPDTSAKDMEKAGGNPAMGLAMGMGLGQVSEFQYTKEAGGRLSVQVMSDSPMIGMFRMIATNPAAMQEGSELIKYGTHSAVLESQKGGKNYKLQRMIADRHMVIVELRGGGDDDFLLSVFDQATVDRLAAVLAK